MSQSSRTFRPRSRPSHQSFRKRVSRAADRFRLNDSTGWDFPVDVGGVRLRNPVIASSGTYGYGLEYSRYGDPSLLGAVVVKSLTVDARPGFPPPRVTLLEEPGSMRNAIGVPNPGVRQWADETLPAMIDAGAPVVASIWGVDEHQVIRAAEILSEYEGPLAWEINLSCPNSDHPGSPVSHSPSRAAEVCHEVRGLAPAHIGIWAKLAPDAPDVSDVAAACHQAGAGAVVVSNTYPASSLALSNAPRLGGGTGGLSGAILREYTRPLVEKVTSTDPELPVIACGGVLNSEIAMDYLDLGATAVQVGTASLFDPRACHKIARGLVRRLQRESTHD